MKLEFFAKQIDINVKTYVLSGRTQGKLIFKKNWNTFHEKKTIERQKSIPLNYWLLIYIIFIFQLIFDFSLQQFKKVRRFEYQKKLEKNFLLLGWPISLLSDSHFYHTILISIFLIVVPTLRFSSIYMCLCVCVCPSVSIPLYSFLFLCSQLYKHFDALQPLLMSCPRGVRQILNVCT